ncbi:Eukaryotic translation initiation factor 3 subunit I [Trichinella britovi]|uniref:Eukaryotic translation initiation factor 3 subunit I n=1 Tax=Trichinella britovi TaxID=45882 RepID=A0A0V1DD64_TRIBR|nr:Eukaryotic translation initiation factor 3 subunit I [Trichinella britovi]
MKSAGIKYMRKRIINNCKFLYLKIVCFYIILRKEMKPLVLKRHERPITKVKFNREGDLLFSCSKDSLPIVWYADNGEMLGVYEGHNGVVWCVDLTWNTRFMVTGGGDNQCLLWDVETGDVVQRFVSPTTVRTVGFSFSGSLFFYTNDPGTNEDAALSIFDGRDENQMEGKKPGIVYRLNGKKATSGLWAHLDDTVLLGTDHGELVKYDLRKPDLTAYTVKEHKREVMDLKTSNEQILVISASKDNTARLFDVKTLECLKTYKAERPVNSAAISPIRDHVMLGGGLEAMNVTTTDTRHGHFEAKLYHMIFEEEFARVKGHFGPINSLTFHPNGQSFVTGGEDGNIRINEFDEDYFHFDYDY